MSNSPETLCYNAEKRMKSQGFLSFFFSRPNYDEAAELYVQAANKYKLEKNWKKAAETWLLAAKAYELGKNWYQQASMLVESGHCKKKYSMKEASQVYEEAASLYKEQGQFHQAAKLVKTVAELNEETNYAAAMEAYKSAAELFDMDEFGKSQKSNCLVKYAELCSRHGNNLGECIKIFEEEAMRNLRNNLLQYSAKAFFFKAGLLSLVKGDMYEAWLCIERYKKLDSRFASSREAKILETTLECIKENNATSFTEALQDFNSIKHLDAWHIHFFVLIKQNLEPKHGKLASLAEYNENNEVHSVKNGDDLAKAEKEEDIDLC